MKTVAVIGLGKFGFYIAKTLSRLDIRVIAIDNNEQRIQEIAEYIEDAYIADSTNKSALEQIGIYKLDRVVVSIGENIEASILTVMALKELGNQHIIAKAITTTHGDILAKLGASKVVHPEKIAGRMLVNSLVENPSFEKIDLSNSMRIIKFVTPLQLVGTSLQKFKNSEFEVKLIAYKNDGNWYIHLDDHYTVKKGDTLAFLGDGREVERFYKTIRNE